MTDEFGVQWRSKSGRVFVAGGYTETGARGIVAACGGPANEPRAVRVVRRPSRRGSGSTRTRRAATEMRSTLQSPRSSLRFPVCWLNWTTLEPRSQRPKSGCGDLVGALGGEPETAEPATASRYLENLRKLGASERLVDAAERAASDACPGPAASGTPAEEGER